MSHALTIRSNNFAEFAATHGTKVWHGLGQRLERGASIEEWSVAAGLDWRVQSAKVRFATAHGQSADAWSEMPDQLVLLRSDTKEPLGIVSKRYHIAQPLQLLQTLKNEATAAGFELETAGSLHGGKVVWAMASDGQEAEIGKGDRILARTLLKTNTDGGGATEGYQTEILVVCANTMRAATQGNKAIARVTHRTKYDASRMAHKLGLIHNDNFETRVDSYRRLADKALSEARAERIVFDILKPEGISTNVADVQKVTDSLAFKRIMNLFNGEGMGAKMDGRKGTAWGLLNSFTEYCDHWARSTSTDNRVESAWFGLGDKLKTKAGEALAALV